MLENATTPGAPCNTCISQASAVLEITLQQFLKRMGSTLDFWVNSRRFYSKLGKNPPLNLFGAIVFVLQCQKWLNWSRDSYCRWCTKGTPNSR